jgi:bile acid:Na+ symporter, BASS family
VVPAVGIVLTRVFPLKPEEAATVLLLACTPGGINALQFTTKIKGASLFAGCSAFLMSFIAVFLSPVLLQIFTPGRTPILIPYGRASLYILVFLLAPLVAGALVRRKSERLAKKVSMLCAVISTVVFFAVLILTMDIRKEAMSTVGKEALLCMLLFILISMGVGWLMGGPAKETRPVLATITGMRNVALCLLIALYTFPGFAVQKPLVALSALMLPPNMLLTLYIVIRSRWRRPRTSATGSRLIA